MAELGVDPSDPVYNDMVDTLVSQLAAWSVSGTSHFGSSTAPSDIIKGIFGDDPDLPAHLSNGGMHYLRENSLLAEVVEEAAVPLRPSAPGEPPNWGAGFRGASMDRAMFERMMDEGLLEPGATWRNTRMNSISPSSRIAANTAFYSGEVPYMMAI